MATPAKPEVYMAGRAGAKAAPTSKTSVAQQKAKLREVFDKFDVDGSGAVSTEEMKSMVKMLKLDLSDASIKKMMADADPDGSGEISFEEFVTVVKKQSESGGGDGLASVVAEAGSAFGWLNPLNWFAAAEETEPVKEQSVERPARTKSASPTGGPPPARASPGRPPSPLGSVGSPGDSPGTSKYYARTPESMRSTLEFTPTHRMKATQGLVQAANAELASEMKTEFSVAQQRAAELQERFLARQQARIEKAREQQEQTAHAVELLKYQKRYEGWEMKTEMKAAWQEEQVKKAKFAASANKRVTSAKKRKARQTSARHKEAQEHSMAASIASKVERSQRREQALSTKRAEEQAAQEYAAQVRYETRPEVRQEGREMFQAQRNATTAEVKRMQEENASKIAKQKQAYLAKQEAMKAKVEAMHAVARGSREGLLESRKQQAAVVRSQLDRERARKLELDRQAIEEVKEKRDAVYIWHKLGIVEP